MAGPPSPEEPIVPLPATVLMTPFGVTLRIRLKSAMNRLPVASAATPWGAPRDALVAGPPSPEPALLPLPATVLIIPSRVTFRIRWLPRSAMKRLPAASTATPQGRFRDALVAGPP